MVTFLVLVDDDGGVKLHVILVLHAVVAARACWNIYINSYFILSN